LAQDLLELMLVDVLVVEILLKLAEDVVDLEIPGFDLVADLLEDFFDGGLWTMLIAAKLIIIV